jgi:hypothetical protein
MAPKSQDLRTAPRARLGGRVSNLKALADALAKLHADERTAFDLNDRPAEAGSDSLAALLGSMRGSTIKPVADVPEDD